MNFIKTDIDGVIICEPKLFVDDRGYFYETYNYEVFAGSGIDCTFVQDNQSRSLYGTIRGIHFQKGWFSQAKLVRCISGRVRDIAVDLRPNSKTFGRHVAVELSGRNHRQLFIPRGFGHGFSVLSHDALFEYKCDNLYNSQSEGGINCRDPQLGIDWQIPQAKEIISPKDKMLPLLKDIER